MKRWLLMLAVPSVSGCHGCAGAGTVSAPSVNRTPSFRRDILPVLVDGCASAEGCHGNKPTDSVTLDLRSDAAYAQLVTRAAQAREGAARVKPGDVSGSFLVDKLEGRLRAGEGKAMPLDSQTGAPLTPSPLPPDYVEKVLKPWIEAGASNN